MPKALVTSIRAYRFETPKLMQISVRKSRQSARCWWCDEWIVQGETYLGIYHDYGSNSWYETYCLDCITLDFTDEFYYLTRASAY